MELNDKEFDATFRKKVFDAELRFEEAAWDKMEQKLRRRDRVVFFRKASALCLLLLVFLGGYLMFDRGLQEKPKTKIAGRSKQEHLRSDKATEITRIPQHKVRIENQEPKSVYVNQSFFKKNIVIDFSDSLGNQKNEDQPLNGKKDSINTVLAGIVMPQSVQEPDVKQDSTQLALSGADVLQTSVVAVKKKQKSGARKPFPLSLSFSAGPEFNSSGAVLGGKTGFSAGFGFSVGIAKRISLQTGLKYSMKDYAAENYEYKFKSIRAKDIISKVDASCAVLEIPLQASYTVLEDAQKSIDLNVGMSSYFMLKEDYTYRYNAGSGIADRFQEYKNRNQHYFGVADLSATYYVKLKKEGLKLGLEPYVKIPLTGVGEGKVNLKSSGISLKLRYDLGKKNN